MLEFLFDAIQRGRLLFGQALVGAGLRVHLPGKDGILFLFAGDQDGELLVVFEGGVLAAQFGAQLFDFAVQLTQRLAGVAGRQEGTGPEAGAGLAERLVKPDGEGTGQLEAIHRFLVPGAELVRRLVALDAQRVEHLAHRGVEADFAIEPEQQVGLAGFAVELDAGAGRDVLGQCFAELAQLDQRGVGVSRKDLLGGAGQLQEDGVMLGEKGEIAGNGHGPGIWLGFAFGMRTNLTRFAKARPVDSRFARRARYRAAVRIPPSATRRFRRDGWGRAIPSFRGRCTSRLRATGCSRSGGRAGR